jgi:hypothetical protein
MRVEKKGQSLKLLRNLLVVRTHTVGKSVRKQGALQEKKSIYNIKGSSAQGP